MIRSLVRPSVVCLALCIATCGVNTGKSNAADNRSLVGETSLNLLKGLDLDQWCGSANFAFPIAGNGNLTAEEFLDVQLWRIPGYTNQWKVNHRFRSTLSRQISERFLWQANGRFDQFLDDHTRRIGNTGTTQPLLPKSTDFSSSRLAQSAGHSNEIRNGRLTTGLLWNSPAGIQLQGAAGPLFEQRWGRRQQGLRYDIAVSAEPLDSRINAEAWLTDLPDGTENGQRTNLASRLDLTEQAFNFIQLEFSSSTQREALAEYASAARRHDRKMVIDNRLISSPSTGLQMEWTSSLMHQRAGHTGGSFEYTDIEFFWNNTLGFDYLIDIWRFSSAGGVDLQEQQYAGSITQGQRTHLAASAGKFGNRGDSLVFSARTIRYRFDTPDENDFNDRDELRYILALHAGTPLTPGLGLRARLEADMNHLVYIYSARSSENRWIRLFTLATDIPWDNGYLTNNARFTVVGNYSAYDFAPFDITQSRAFRYFTAADSLRIDVFGNVQLHLDAAWTLEDHGRMRWKKWTQDIAEDGRSWSFRALPMQTGRNWRAGIGWTLHQRRTWQHLADDHREILEFVRSSGPILKLDTTGKPLHFEFEGLWLTVTDRLRGNYRLPDIRLNLVWRT